MDTDKPIRIKSVGQGGQALRFEVLFGPDMDHDAIVPSLNEVDCVDSDDVDLIALAYQDALEVRGAWSNGGCDGIDGYLGDSPLPSP